MTPSRLLGLINAAAVIVVAWLAGCGPTTIIVPRQDDDGSAGGMSASGMSASGMSASGTSAGGTSASGSSAGGSSAGGSSAGGNGGGSAAAVGGGMQGIPTECSDMISCAMQDGTVSTTLLLQQYGANGDCYEQFPVNVCAADCVAIQASLSCPQCLDASDSCEGCVIQQCIVPVDACCGIQGCMEVFLCAQEKMCTGLECYNPANCAAEIDAVGIVVALDQATAVEECASAQCATECYPE